MVIDGTGMGILRTLPQFHRHTKVLSAVERVTDRHYLMRDPKLRSFVDSILISAK